MNRALLDTHTVLWWLVDDERLSADARKVIGNPDVQPLVSIASIWEIAIKRATGKLRAQDSLLETIAAEGFRWLEIEPEHAWAVSRLEFHHRDPFDRLLIAQAVSESLPLVTADGAFAPYPIEVIW